MEKCPVCKKFWEEDWKGQQYCPQCGMTPAQAQELVARKVTPKPAPTPKIQPTPQPPQYTPQEQFILALIEKLYAEHGIEHHPTVFRNRKGSYAHRPGNVPQIVLGYESVERCFKQFTEYRSIAYLWTGQGELSGLRGLWALALHEFGHVLQFHTGRLYAGVGENKYHNHHFVELVRELQVLYPFDEQL